MIVRPSKWTRAAALSLWLAAGTAAVASAQDSTAGYAPTDSARQSGAASRAAALRAVTIVAPPDTVLARACAGLPAGAEAPGLLAVVFRPGTSDTARAAAARAVGGTRAGTSQYGEEYVQVPPDAGPLPAVADRLIRQDPVMTVSAAPCPAPAEAPAPTPAPGAAGAAGAALPGGATPGSAVRDSTARDSTGRNATVRDSTARDSTARSSTARDSSGARAPVLGP